MMIFYSALVLCMTSLLTAVTIVIDPGHGGTYRGTMSPSGKVIEKEATLAVALQVAERLRKKGYTVILTRETDKALDESNLMDDLAKRAQVAVDHKADLFVSVHFNGAENQGSRGYEVYVPYEDKFPLQSYALAGALHYDISHEIKPDFGGGNLGNLNYLDRGIRASKFNVLKKAPCPAALIELAYISNPPTEKMILEEGYEPYVTAVTNGIQRYCAHAKRAS